MKWFFSLLLTILITTALFSNENDVLSKMTLREKIGQLCVLAAAIDEEADAEMIQAWHEWQPLYRLNRSYIEKMIQENHVGGIIYYGNKASPEKFLQITKRYQSLSQIPLLITLDAELGLGSRLNKNQVVTFPYNMTLAAVNQPSLAYKAGFIVGKQLKALGVHVNFAPVMDVNNNPANPVIGMRSFGSDKKRVAELGIAYMKGQQDAGIIACAKHFPGHGDTSVDSHYALPLIEHSVERLHQIELYPFKEIFQAGVKAVMTAHLEIPSLEPGKGLPVTLSKSVVTDLLQNDLQFKGLIFTDALGMKGLADHFPPGEIELKALLAGHDVLLCPQDVELAINRIEKAVLEKEISVELIDQKVLKILEAKKAIKESPPEIVDERKNEFLTRMATTLRKIIFQQAVTLEKENMEFIDQLSLDNTAVISTDPSLKSFEETLKKHKEFQLYHAKFEAFVESFSPSISSVILCVSKNTYKKEHEEQLKGWIKDFKSSGKNVTLVSFDNPYTVQHIEVDQQIFAYETADEAQEAAAEVLAGIRVPAGQFPCYFD